MDTSSRSQRSDSFSITPPALSRSDTPLSLPRSQRSEAEIPSPTQSPVQSQSQRSGTPPFLSRSQRSESREERLGQYQIPPPPERSYKSLRDLELAVHEWTKKLGYDLVYKGKTKKNQNGKIKGQVYYKTMACAFSGMPRKRVNNEQPRKRKLAGSYRKGCTMSIIVVADDPQKVDGSWSVRFKQNNKSKWHNHEPVKELAAFPNHRRRARTEEIVKTIRQQRVAGIEPGQTLAVIQQDQINPAEKLMIRKDIQNTRLSCRQEGLGSKSIIEALEDQLRQKQFFYRIDIDPEHRVCSILIIHPEAILLFKKAYEVLQLDCTFKTNKYNRPVLNFIAANGENNTIPLGLALMTGGKQQPFEWQLRAFREMLDENGIPHPKVVITDREQACINAIGETFPQADRLLCRWHINKAVQHWIRTHFGGIPAMDQEETEDGVEFVMNDQMQRAFDMYFHCANAKTEEEFEIASAAIYNKYPDVAAYLERTWFPYREMWVKAWTNKVRHFDQEETSRTEGYHAVIKKWLKTSSNDILGLFESLLPFWSSVYHQLRVRPFQTNLKTSWAFRNELYINVNQHIYRYALVQVQKQVHFAQDELQALAKGTRSQRSRCEGVFQVTMGLPCKHECMEILERGGSFQLSNFDRHWWLKPTMNTLPEPRLREPTVVRKQRKGMKKLAKKKGTGVTGIKRDLSEFELTESDSPAAKRARQLPASQPARSKRPLLPNLQPNLQPIPQPIVQSIQQSIQQSIHPLPFPQSVYPNQQFPSSQPNPIPTFSPFQTSTFNGNQQIPPPVNHHGYPQQLAQQLPSQPNTQEFVQNVPEYGRPFLPSRSYAYPPRLPPRP